MSTQEKTAAGEDSRQSLTGLTRALLRPLSASTFCFPQILQEKDEMLHELEKELAQVQNSLMKKEMELEKQQRMTTELEITIQEVKQDKSRAECGALQAEIQKLKDCLEDAQQQQKLIGKAPAGSVPVPSTLQTHRARAVPFFL